MSALEEFERERSCGLVRMSTVEAHEPDFLWWPYLRLGNLNLLRGNGGSGKTSITFALAAAISRGIQPKGMPGRLNVDGPGIVIYLGSEDDLPEYRAMLDANGADADNILIPDSHIPTLGEIATLEKMVRTFSATLLVIDPVQALLPDGVDMNKSNQIRPLLDGLRSVCRETGCTALILEHLNKMTKSANTYRGSGSMDFYNASRSVLMAGWTEDGQRACGHLKSNGAAYGPCILFQIDDGGHLSWCGSDQSISGEDIEATRPKEAVNPAPNPYEVLVRAIANQRGPWEGTASQAIAISPSLGVGGASSPESFGRFVRTHKVAGVKCTSKSTNKGTVYRLEVEQ